ncbi:MAG: hypothetical protein V2G33_05810 [bacterium JZ-2024 1]
MILLCPICRAELSESASRCPGCGARTDILFHTVRVGELYLQKVRNYLERRNYLRAWNALKKAAAFLPDSHPEFCYLKAKVCARLGKFDIAVRIASQQGFPEKVEWEEKSRRKQISREWLLFSFWLREKKYFLCAEQQMDRARQLLPEWEEPYWFHFFYALTRGNFSSAYRSLAYLSQMYPDSLPPGSEFSTWIEALLPKKSLF